LHRRESFGKPLQEICLALKEIALSFPDMELVYPVHLNPNVRRIVFKVLNNIPNIHLVEPLDYPVFVWLMKESYMILTDSGGIQEEAPSLGKPVFILRDVSERQETIRAGTAKLVGTKKGSIVSSACAVLKNKNLYKRMARKVNLYGDGMACARIIKVLENERN
jgi:UDP-N-acetylglucosamine 2-epimerase (non-hydrolysing)